MHVQLEWSEALAQQDWKQSLPRMVYHPAVVCHPDSVDDKKISESLVYNKSQLRNLMSPSASGSQLASYLSKNQASTLFANTSDVSYTTKQLG